MLIKTEMLFIQSILYLFLLGSFVCVIDIMFFLAFFFVFVLNIIYDQIVTHACSFFAD